MFSIGTSLIMKLVRYVFNSQWILVDMSIFREGQAGAMPPPPRILLSFCWLYNVFRTFFYSYSNPNGFVDFQECKHAYYIHCFVHPLKLILVAIAREIDEVHEFFFKKKKLVDIINVVCASPKSHDELQQQQAVKIVDLISLDELETRTCSINLILHNVPMKLNEVDILNQ